MKMAHTWRCILILSLAVVMLSAAGAGIAAEKKLSISTGPIGGSWYPIGGAVATVVGKYSPYTVDVTVGGGITNIERVNKGEADIGLGNACSVVDAYYAQNYPFEGTPRKNLANMLTFTSTTLQIAVRRDSGVKTIPDLKGKKFAAGKKSYTQRILFDHLLKAYGMSFDDLGGEFRGGFSDSATMVKDNHVAGMLVLTLVPAPVYTELAISTSIDIISLPEDTLKKVLSYNKGYIRKTVPANTYKGVDYPAESFGTLGSFIVRRDLSDETVYNMTKALVEHLTELGEVHASLKGLTPEMCVTDVGIPFHPGAEKYYREKGLIQ